MTTNKTTELKKEILNLIEKYYEENHKELPATSVPVSGKVYDAEELKNIVEAALEGWWTESVWIEKFEEKLKKFLGVKYALTLNSGSSANLIALTTLTSTRLGDRKINKGDEVITVAAGFPTTINPIIQIGAIPVFVDVDLPTYSINIKQMRQALSNKTKAVMIAHTLGNPFNISEVKKFCEENNLWLIEDNCDALGSIYDEKRTGTFGDLATSSFYPAHHITTAEGGAIYTNNEKLYQIAKSFMSWGRACYCSTGKDNTCRKRFEWKLGDLPYGYDHKYIYSEMGYNLKMTDLQAAIGVAQLDKLEHFIDIRRKNFLYLHKKFSELSEYFILPEATENSNPSWFGFLLLIKDSSIDRTKLLQYLNSKGIATRLLFGGNIIRQPYFINNKLDYRKIGTLENSDNIMNNAFWIGLYPLLSHKHLDYAFETIKEYLSGDKNL